MRNISADILNQLRASELTPFFLFKMVIESIKYRYTDCDVSLLYNSEVYSPRGINIEPISYSRANIVDSFTIGLDNIGEDLTSTFFGGTPQGSDVNLYVTFLDSSNAIIDTVNIFTGYIDAWEADESSVIITVSSIFTQWQQTPVSRQPASCRWKKFKGTECGYAGTETECDRSYTRCQALSNTANFGGFRWLPSIMDKEIWWGRTAGYQN